MQFKIYATELAEKPILEKKDFSHRPWEKTLIKMYKNDNKLARKQYYGKTWKKKFNVPSAEIGTLRNLRDLKKPEVIPYNLLDDE